MDLSNVTKTIDVRDRTDFLRQTYTHLFTAILGFVGLLFLFFQMGWAYPMANAMLSVSWLFVLGGFVVASWMASHFARTAQTQGGRYAALFGFVIAEAIIFTPLMVIAEAQIGFNVIGDAALVTLLAFSALTALVFYTKKDFSFLRIFLMWGGICALILIVLSVLLGFNMGLIFSVAMVCLAGASILYDTSNVLHYYQNDQYVSAALELFASVALLFWYVLRIFMARR